MRRFLFLLAFALVAAIPAAGSAFAGDNGATWRVTIANLTPPGPGAPGSQPLSPPLFVVHSSSADVWSVGTSASRGVAALAEDADTSVLEAALPGMHGVKTVFTGAGGPIASGTSRSFMVETSGAFDRLSILTMLVNTNDAFTGLDSLRLRGHGGSLSTIAYDAGSERNNELRAFIPGPCCNHPFVRDPEHAVIRPHEGITGRGDLDPSVYGWHEPATRISIERVS